MFCRFISLFFYPLFLPSHLLEDAITAMSQVPRVEDLTLAGFLNKFRSYREMDPADNQPEPDMIAARYALTGLSRDSRRVAGINTVRDKLRPQGTLPFIRRDFDSLIGFCTDIPVSKDVAYYPNPPPIRTLNKSVYVKHDYLDGGRVCRCCSYSLLEYTDNLYSLTSLSVRPSWTAMPYHHTLPTAHALHRSLHDLPGLPSITTASCQLHMQKFIYYGTIPHDLPGLSYTITLSS